MWRVLLALDFDVLILLRALGSSHRYRGRWGDSSFQLEPARRGDGNPLETSSGSSRGEA